MFGACRLIQSALVISSELAWLISNLKVYIFICILCNQSDNHSVNNVF